MSECEYNIRKMSLSEPMYDGPMVEMDMVMEEEIIPRHLNYDEIVEEANDLIRHRLTEDARPMRT
jgi:hypothetical protein